MDNRDTTMFSWFSLVTIVFLAIVLSITLLTAVSGVGVDATEEKSYDAPPSAQELLSIRSAQERAASEAGFSSQHKIETVYPQGWELQKAENYPQEKTSKPKGFFSVERDLALIDMQVFGANLYLSPRNASMLFGFITIVLTIFAVTALSVPFVRILEQE
jgi:hypothetical protein